MHDKVVNFYRKSNEIAELGLNSLINILINQQNDHWRSAITKDPA